MLALEKAIKQDLLVQEFRMRRLQRFGTIQAESP